MKNQVLSIEQMQELIKLGIDVSTASMCRITNKNTGKYDLRVNRIEWKDIYTANYYSVIPTFTLQDILEMLPRTLEFQDVYGNTHFEYIEFWGDCWNQMAVIDPSHPSSPRVTTSNISPLRAAFDMLKWCKQNKYI